MVTMVTTGHQAQAGYLSFQWSKWAGGKIYSIQWQWLLWGWGGMIDFKIDFNAFSEKWTNLHKNYCDFRLTFVTEIFLVLKFKLKAVS